MWFFYAILAGFLSTISGLAGRHILRGKKDTLAYSFYFSFFGALVSLPFMLFQYQGGHTVSIWLFMVFVGALIVLQNFLVFKSTSFLEASIGGAIVKFRLVWAFILGILVLHEIFTWEKLLGTILTIAAGLVIIHKFRAPKSLKGFTLAFSSTILYAIIIIFFKFLFVQFNSVTLTFFIFLVPAIFNYFLMPNRFARVVDFFKKNTTGVLIACILGAFSNLAINQALAIGEVSKVLVINEAFLILTLVGEHIFLKEKENLWIKVVAVILATLGAILIRLS